MVLVVLLIIAHTKKAHKQDQSVDTQYQNQTGQKLNPMLTNKVHIGIKDTTISKLDSILKYRFNKKKISFTPKGMVLLAQKKSKMNAHMLIPYSDITRWTYSIKYHENFNNRGVDNRYYQMTIKIMLRYGSLEIKHLILKYNSTNDLRKITYLDKHTNSSQKVAPAYDRNVKINASDPTEETKLSPEEINKINNTIKKIPILNKVYKFNNRKDAKTTKTFIDPYDLDTFFYKVIKVPQSFDSRQQRRDIFKETIKYGLNAKRRSFKIN